MIEELQKLISTEYNINLIGIPLETKLSDLQGQDDSFDSLNRVSFLIEIEKHFDVELPSKVATLGEIISVLTKGKSK